MSKIEPELSQSDEERSQSSVSDAESLPQSPASPQNTPGIVPHLTKPATTHVSQEPMLQMKHTSSREMVHNALKHMKEPNGSSVMAIKKFIYANYHVDEMRMTKLINKYLKKAIASGVLVQTKGKGANGSVKLPVNAKKDKKSKPATKNSKPTAAADGSASDEGGPDEGTATKKTKKGKATKEVAAVSQKSPKKKAKKTPSEDKGKENVKPATAAKEKKVKKTAEKGKESPSPPKKGATKKAATKETKSQPNEPKAKATTTTKVKEASATKGKPVKSPKKANPAQKTAPKKASGRTEKKVA